MKINGKEYLSPQEQLFENTKDIEELKQVIKPVYQTTAELTSSSVSVALSDTNIGDATEGWLMTNDGLLFKITANDGTTVLLKFYSDFKGPQGESGADDIDDSAIANNKVWSSQKVNNSLDKGIFTTMVEPTDLGGGAEFRLDYEDAPILTSGIHVRVNDLIIYIDGDDKAKSIYSVSAVYDEYVYLAKQGDFGGGKQLYLNNIYINSLKWTSGDTRYYIGTIILILDVQFTTASDFINWYKDISSDVACDGIGMGYGSGYISHLRKLRVPTIVADKTSAKFDLIHNLNGSVAFTDNQSSSTFLEDQDIRIVSRAL